MFNDSTIEVTKAIIDVMSQFNRAFSLDEISFRTRTTQSQVDRALDKLTVANVVTRQGNHYRLNKNDEYQLKSLVC